MSFRLIMLCLTLAMMTRVTGESKEAVRSIRPEGDLLFRIRLTEKRLNSHPFDLDFIVQDVARHPDLTRRFEEYQGDVSGRILGAWSYTARLMGERPAKLDSIAERVLTYQSDDGYFGKNQKLEGWDYWGRQNFGHGRLLVGLLQYYRLTQDPKILESATKLGDYFVRSISEWTSAHEGNPWQSKEEGHNRQHFIKTHQTSVLEGLMMLYDVSGKSGYLEAGRSLVQLFPEFGTYHSHSYLNTMVGIAMLYEKTRESGFLELLKRIYWQDCFRYTCRADGAVPEWYPIDFRTEGCSITDWIRLNLWMWRITQESVYLDEAEKAWLNALNFHQTPNGLFGHAIITPTGYESNYSEAWWCCLMHGLYAYAEIIDFMVSADQSDIWINFYASCTVSLGELELKIQSGYPQNGDIQIQIKSKETSKRKLRLRLPEWADSYVILVAGETVSATKEGGYVLLEQSWTAGEKILLKLPVGLRIEDDRGNDLLKQRRLVDAPYPAYFFHGPLLLGADLKNNDSFPRLLNFDKGNAGTYCLSGTRYQIDQSILVPISEQSTYGEWTEKIQYFRRNSEKPIQRVPVQTKQMVKIH